MGTLSGTNEDTYKGGLVRAYHRQSGAFAGETTSDPSTGDWSITTSFVGNHVVFCHDASHTGYARNRVAIPFLGANNSTVFSTGCGSTATAVSNAKIVTTQTDPFSGSGGVLSIPDTGSYVSVTNIPSGFVTSGDFHIRAWVYLTSALVDGSVFFSGGGSSSLSCRKESTNNLGLVHEYVAWHGHATSDPSTGSWVYLQARRSGSSLNLYYDSTSVLSVTNSDTYTATASLNLFSSFQGYICDFEVLNYAASVTPPTSRLTLLPTPTDNAIIYDDVTPI